MNRLLFAATLVCGLFCCKSSNAQNFDDYFLDKTLRIDYIFAGDAKQCNIYVDELKMEPRWYGKKKRLKEVPIEGNGQIIVRDMKTDSVIYRNSFSTLFQEWLDYDEAKTTRKAFENVFLVPFPKDSVAITVNLMNNRRVITTSYTHIVNPKDILIRHIGERNVNTYVTLQHAADTTRCIHIAYLAEGYRQEEMNTFIDDAKIAVEALFEHEPFKSMRQRFNIVAVEATSTESGTSEPSNGIWKNTALESHFDTFYSSRYLTTLSLKKLNDMLAGTPYEHIIVLVNSDKYGGGGILNSYTLSTTHNKWYKPVVVHEFGHSFAGLGDEYAYESEQIPMYPHDVEPWEPNLTTLKDFHGKWENLIAKGTKIPTKESKDEKTQFNKVGIFEGAGYSMKSVYRGVERCRMRDNTTPEFCPVCRQAITKLINFYTE